MKQFEKFEAIVPADFERKMVLFWRDSEKVTEEMVLEWYYDDDFKSFAKRVVNTKCNFIPDLGYNDTSVDGTLCFEEEDNNYVIPVSILEVL